MDLLTVNSSRCSDDRKRGTSQCLPALLEVRGGASF